MRNPPLRHRLVLAACVAVATALALVSVAFYIVLQHRLDHDANDTLRSRSQAALSTVTVKRGRLAVGEGPRDALLDQRVWVFEGARAIDSPFAPPGVQRRAREMAAAGRPARRDAGSDTRLLAEPVIEGGRRVRHPTRLDDINNILPARDERRQGQIRRVVDVFSHPDHAMLTWSGKTLTETESSMAPI